MSKRGFVSMRINVRRVGVDSSHFAQSLYTENGVIMLQATDPRNNLNHYNFPSYANTAGFNNNVPSKVENLHF